MIIYEVALDAPAPLMSRVERYMRDHHIPAILATGCFASIALERTSPSRIRTRYAATSQADLDRYLSTHTAGFRAEFVERFPSDVTATREIWTAVDAWSR